jgi:hypothetical protein
MSDKCYFCGITEENHRDPEFENDCDFGEAPWIVDNDMFGFPICYACYEDYNFNEVRIKLAHDAVAAADESYSTVSEWLEDNSETILNIFDEYIDSEESRELMQRLIQFAKIN